MDPVTGLMVANAGMQVVGGGKKAKAERKAARANAGIIRQNAAVKRIMAKDATQRGDETEAQHRMRVADLKSTQKASMMANNATMTGSNSNILDDTDFYGELDALTIRRNAAMENWALNTEADLMMSNADAVEAGGQAQANNTILTSAAQVGSTYLNYVS